MSETSAPGPAPLEIVTAQAWQTISDPPPLRHHAALALERVGAVATLWRNAPAMPDADDAGVQLARRVLRALGEPDTTGLELFVPAPAALGREAAIVAATYLAATAPRAQTPATAATDAAKPLSLEAVTMQVLPGQGAPPPLHSVTAAAFGGLSLVGSRHPARTTRLAVPSHLRLVVAWPRTPVAAARPGRTAAKQMHSYRALQTVGQAAAVVAAWSTGDLALLGALQEDPFADPPVAALPGWPAAANSAFAQGAVCCWPLSGSAAWAALCLPVHAPHVAWALQETANAHALDYDVMWSAVAPPLSLAPTSTPAPVAWLPCPPDAPLPAPPVRA